jgi:uncharacterized protein
MRTVIAVMGAMIAVAGTQTASAQSSQNPFDGTHLLLEPKSPPAVVGARPHRPEVGPSFDCRRAQSSIETMICGNKSLSALDRKLDAAYKPFGSLIRADQRAWLADLVCHGGGTLQEDENCVSQSYTDRISQLTALVPYLRPSTKQLKLATTLLVNGLKCSAIEENSYFDENSLYKLEFVGDVDVLKVAISRYIDQKDRLGDVSVSTYSGTTSAKFSDLILPIERSPTLLLLFCKDNKKCADNNGLNELAMDSLPVCSEEMDDIRDALGILILGSREHQ